jgi:RNA polymerase sigma factor (sigma-70 family)
VGAPRASGVSFRLLPDTRLTQLAARGSEGAFSEIFRRYHQRLYRYANSILGNDDDARDAVQTSMVKLLDSLPGDRRRIELKPWLFRITHNEAISIIRRRRECGLDSVPDPSLATDDADLRLRAKTLITDLAELPDRQRSALVMRELCGLSFKEIGLALSSSTAAAKQAVYEGRQALQQLETGREMDCDSARATISANDRRLLKGRQIRAHLKSCAPCRDFELGIRGRREGLAALAPLPLGAAHEMLQQILGSGAGPAGGLGALGALGAAKALGGGAAMQVATGAVVISGAGMGIATEGGNGGQGTEREAVRTSLAAAAVLTDASVGGAVPVPPATGRDATSAIAGALSGVGGTLGSVRTTPRDDDPGAPASGDAAVTPPAPSGLPGGSAGPSGYAPAGGGHGVGPRNPVTPPPGHEGKGGSGKGGGPPANPGKGGPPSNPGKGGPPVNPGPPSNPGKGGPPSNPGPPANPGKGGPPSSPGKGGPPVNPGPPSNPGKGGPPSNPGPPANPGGGPPVNPGPPKPPKLPGPPKVPGPAKPPGPPNLPKQPHPPGKGGPGTGAAAHDSARAPAAGA